MATVGKGKPRRSPNKRDREQFEGSRMKETSVEEFPSTPTKKKKKRDEKKRDDLLSSQDALTVQTTWVHHRPPQAKKHSFLFQSEKGRPNDRKKGFLVSCNRPSQAISGIFLLLNKVAERCYEENIDAWKRDVARIVEQHRDPPSTLNRIIGRKLKFFQTVNSGCKGVLIVAVRSTGKPKVLPQPKQILGPSGSPEPQQLCPPSASPTDLAAMESFDEHVLSKISPSQVTRALLEEMHRVYSGDDGAEKADFGRNAAFLGRVLPMDVIVEAKPELILEAARPIVERNFPSKKTDPCLKYSIQVSVRNNTLKKTVLIDIVGKLVGTHHIVDLANPDLCILVEVTKAACGISVVKDYYAFRKFNVKMVLDKGHAKPPAAKFMQGPT